MLSHLEGLYAHVDVREDHGLCVDKGAHYCSEVKGWRRLQGQPAPLHLRR